MQQQNIAVPVAIVAAGILIAGAIIFTNQGGSPSTGGGVVKSPDNIATLAKVSGINEKKLSACMAEGKHADRVEQHFQEGILLGVSGTPSSFIVHTNGRVEKIGGALPFQELKKIIDSMGTNNTPTQGQETQKGGALAIRSDDHVLGDPKAPIVLFEYSDYQCPFCKSFHPTTEQVMETYGKKGEVAIVYRHFPLDSIHPQARPLAIGAECATELGGNDAFWKYTQKVMGTRGDFDLATK